ANLTRGAALNVAARVATLLLGLLLLGVVARQGPQVQGALALFISAEALLLALCSGLGLVLAREVSHHRAEPAPLVRSMLRLALLLGLVAALAPATVSALSSSAPYRQLWLLALAAPLLLWVPTASGLWLGQGRLLLLNAPAVATPALVLLLLGLMQLAGWRSEPALLAVLIAWVLGKSVIALIAAWAALREPAATLPAAPAPAWRPHLRFVATVGLANVVSLLNLRLTLFIVERSHGLAEAGVYSVAVQIAELLWVLSSAVTVSAYHRIAGVDTPQAARLTLRALRLGLGLALVAAPLLGALAWVLLPRLLGPDYDAARAPLLVLLPGVALYAGASSLSAFYTNQQGRPQWAARVAASSLGLTVLIAAWSVPRFGGLGAALATSLAYSAAFVWALRGFLRDQRLGWAALFRPAAAPQSAGA
ncbi:MAG: teichoic acid transporter, partial [Rubrivivax sp.]